MNKRTIDAFLALVRAGLWAGVESSDLVNHVITESVDWNEVYQLSGEQSVVGLVTAGIEHVKDIKIPQDIVLQFIGESLQLEQNNREMNDFIAEIVDKMRKEDIYTLLVKGQGIAQCYERPLWRASGDVDLLLSDSNYINAKRLLLSMATVNKNEERYSKHLGMNIDSWYVEIHGTMRTGLSGRVDKVVDSVQHDIFYGGNVRSWMNGKTSVILPAPDNDVIFVFTHFLKHFYKEGMSLRQVCDWCRLLWTYRDSLNHELLKSQICKAGLISEWKAFAALAVDGLGMPKKAMPLYSAESKWRKKGQKIMRFILKGGRPSTVSSTFEIARIFPCNTLRFLPAIFFKVNWLKIKERLF